PLFAALAGCTTLSAPYSAPGSEPIRLLVQQSEGDLRKLLFDLADPAAVPAFAEISAGLDAARVAVATDAVLGAADFGADFGLALQAERAALGVTLKICADGVDRMAALGRADAASYARGTFAFTCLVPLGMFAAR
ncbi:MAG: hypothetical protein ACRC1J_12375, partial [Sandaracinobacteroides sp.]